MNWSAGPNEKLGKVSARAREDQSNTFRALSRRQLEGPSRLKHTPKQSRALFFIYFYKWFVFRGRRVGFMVCLLLFFRGDEFPCFLCYSLNSTQKTDRFFA